MPGWVGVLNRSIARWSCCNLRHRKLTHSRLFVCPYQLGCRRSIGILRQLRPPAGPTRLLRLRPPPFPPRLHFLTTFTSRSAWFDIVTIKQTINKVNLFTVCTRCSRPVRRISNRQTQMKAIFLNSFYWWHCSLQNIYCSWLERMKPSFYSPLYVIHFDLRPISAHLSMLDGGYLLLLNRWFRFIWMKSCHNEIYPKRNNAWKNGECFVRTK